MTINFPGPYEVRLFYTTNAATPALTHQARYNVILDGVPDVGDPFSSILAVRRDGSPFPLDGEVDDWVTLCKGLYSSAGGAASIDYAELWKYTAGTFDASYVSTYSIAQTGSSASPLVAGQETIVTFRTTLGGIMKIYWLETIISTVSVDTLPFSNTTLDTMADQLIAGTFPWIGRDGGYPIAAIAAYPGQSEALFKKRNRP